MPDHLVRCLSRDGRLRAVAALTTTLTENLRKRQGTDPTATVALGRLATGTALLGALLKGDQRLALRVEGNGPLRCLQAETDADGHVRASIAQPVSGLKPGTQGFEVAKAVGRAGFLTVTKDLGLRQPYRGMVQLYSSEIAEDLAYYLTTSEQTPSCVALGLFLEADGQVSAAGGYLLQVMPPRDDQLLGEMESHLRSLPSPSELLRGGLTPRAMLAQVLSDHPYDIVQETPLIFRCSCSRDQVARVVTSLPDDERLALRNDGGAVVTCEFCKESYRFSPEELA